MICEDIAKISELFGTCVLEQAEQAVREARIRADEEGEDNDVLKFKKGLSDVANVVSTCPTVIGTPDDYHNLAVEFARASFMDDACTVLDRGLVSYPSSTDLISDYLKYGMQLGRAQDCEKYYNKLKNISMRRWTWRSFSFSIDYLIEKLDRDLVDDVEILYLELDNLANKFVEFMPYDEECFVSKADVAKILMDRNAEIECLDEGLRTLAVAPKCALRRADLYFEQGDFEQCIELLKRCETDALQPQLSVNLNYVSMLSLLCIVSLGMRGSEDYVFGGNTDDRVADDMRKMYRQAKELPGRRITGKVLQTVSKLVEIKTGYDISEY